MTDMDFFRKEVASHLSSFNLEYRSYATALSFKLR